MKHLVSMEDLSLEEIEALLDRADEFKRGAKSDMSEEQFIVNMFFEPSTRTHYSFEVAERKLGLQVVSFDAGESSVTKGETLYDTVLTMQALGVQAAVIRHPDEKFYEKLADLEIAVISGGDGCGEHPSQCLLDLFTIREQFGSFKGLKIAIAGDILHSRVANSNMKVLKRLGAEIFFAGPKEWFGEEALLYGRYLTTDEAAEIADVIMLLRVQHERHQNGSNGFEKKDYHEKYGLTEQRAAKMKQEAIIMHPSPVNRDVEIASTLVESEKSRIVAQMTNGVFVRMAILEAVMNENRKGAEKHVSN
ncbi:aspartate carbamoyltransferase catalytic subunit [Listeria floridensis FSL S10-1187]|uniref:Aspartate carbamoyltransferase n=1 Tax=Listeria floridensis FSL S10-1187 TaxID=1265817 RepID=A0ABP3B0H8_9LIST|nr:aspartate carbamoyltransferase catalytic subunit [Listeria floridensis]EUJ33024.1 aspartate carbamoyltransferase catalytic subunit [Listeria floridensis FSL S10-1187]